jgi:hypothetical protein
MSITDQFWQHAKEAIVSAAAAETAAVYPFEYPQFA